VSINAGTTVKHATFGLGRVVLTSGPYAWTYFPEVSGSPEAATKKLDLGVAALVPSPETSDPRLDHIPVRVVNGRLVFPKASRWTQAEAVAHFLRQYPGGFSDAHLRKAELDYKRNAVLAYAHRFDRGKGRTLLASGTSGLIAESVNDLFQLTNIPSMFEKLAVRDGVKHQQHAAQMLEAVLDFVDEPGAPTFRTLIEAVDRLPASAGKARVLTWPIVTFLPFLADPKRFIVVKPVMTKKAAERLFFDIGYDSHPNWRTYERVLAFCHHLQENLAPLGARDFIDVHSFIWVTAGEPAMEERQS
jgi:hypothetical protein